jgi:hypothetical protein
MILTWKTEVLGEKRVAVPLFPPSHSSKMYISCFLFPSADLKENVQAYNLCIILLPLCTVATAIKPICNCCGTALGCDLPLYPG